MEAMGWTVLFRGGPPADWQGAAKVITDALASPRFTLADTNRAVRSGFGFLNLMLDAEQATVLEQALTSAGFEARGLKWSECEAVDPARRVTRVDFAAPEVVEGLPWSRVHLVHTAIVQGSVLFLPPDANKSTRVAHGVAKVAGIAAIAFGVEDFGLSDGVRAATGAMLQPGQPVTGTPELVIELLGLWAPRVHIAVESFDYGALPAAHGLVRRQRQKALVAAVLERAPEARRAGATEVALAGGSLDALKPLASADHRRQVMAWLTSARLWPTERRAG